MSDPMDTVCSNPGHHDRWTCPGCYADMATKVVGTFTCSSCGRRVVCTLDEEPVCRSRLTQEGDNEDG